MIMCKLVSLKTNYGAKINVADIKKDCISNIVNQAEQCNKIECIILFGSSLEERCKDYSDIDIAIISSLTKSRLFRLASYDKFTTDIYSKNIEQDYDILQFTSWEDIANRNDSICREIIEKGKIIYKRRIPNV